MVTRLPEPPYAVSLIADLHADNLPPDIESQLWPRMRRDPGSLRVLDALDRVTDELRALGRDHSVASTIPDDIAARLDAALDLAPRADEPAVATVHRLPVAAQQPTPIPDESERYRPLDHFTRIDTARTHRRHRMVGIAAAAALAVVAGGVAVVMSMTLHRNSPESVAQAPHSTAASPGAQPVVDLGRRLQASELMGAVGHNGVHGVLANPSRMTGCLQAAGLDRAILGSMNVRFDGADGVLVLVAGTRPAQITAVVLGPDCGPGNAQVLARTDIN